MKTARPTKEIDDKDEYEPSEQQKRKSELMVRIDKFLKLHVSSS